MKSYFLLPIVAAMLVAGCGGGHRDSEPPVTPTTIEGRAIKGVLQDAIVTAFRLDQKGDLADTLATSRTDSEGVYQLILPGANTDPVMVVLTADENTKIVCENTDGCTVGTEPRVDFGKTVAAPATLQLRALLPHVKGEAVNAANISVFSDLAANLADDYAKKNKPVDTLNAAQVNSKISDLLQQYAMLGIGDQVLNIRPVDLSDESEVVQAISDNNDSALKIAFVSAAFNEIAQRDYQGHVETALAAIRAVYVANRGELPKRKSTPGTDVSVGQLLEETRRQIDKVGTKYADKGVSFGNINAQIVAKIDEIKEPVVVIVPPVPLIPPTPIPDVPPAPAPPVPDLPEPLAPPVPELGPVGASPSDSSFTDSHAVDGLAGFLVNDIFAGKDLLRSVRTFGYELNTNSKSVLNGLVSDAGGKIDVQATRESFSDFVDQSRKVYPHIGNIMVAVLQWTENRQADTTYNLAEDPDNLLPDDLHVTGIVTKTFPYWWSSYPVLKLSGGYVEGVGTIDFELAVSSSYSSYCYYCGTYDNANLKLSVKNGDTVFAIASSTLQVSRSYNWKYGTRMPSTANISNAELSVTLGDLGKGAIRVSGVANIGLRWPYEEPKQIPVITNLSLSKTKYQYGNSTGISYFSGRLSYFNNGYNSSPTGDPVEWAKRQATSFSINLGFSATIRVPDPSNPTWSTSKSASIDMSFSNSGYDSSSFGGWGTATIRSVAISYGGESFSISRSSRNNGNDQYRFANRAGAIMELLISKDGKAFQGGKIEYDGKAVANIETSKAGPIIRFTDGTFESF